MLIVDLYREQLHRREFVDPVCAVVEEEGMRPLVRHYNELRKKDIEAATHLIICGTSLLDNDALQDVESFAWLRQYKKPLLGICAGMHLIGLVHGAALKGSLQIGFYQEEFDGFLGLEGEVEVFHLHSKAVDFKRLKGFTIHSRDDTPQAVSKGNLFGVLFHPEVRQQGVIREFLRL